MKDQLSALVDGELEITNSSHLITAVKAGGEMHESWSHYHLIGDVMRGDDFMTHHFTSSVMRLLDQEPTVIAPDLISANKAAKLQTTQDLTTLPNFAKLSSNKPRFNLNKIWSIAASVAAVMFVGVMVMQMQLSGSDELLPVEIAQSGSMEYLQAHQEAAPSGAAYYIQNASFNDAQQ